MKRDDFYAVMERVAAEAEAKIASCHERRACPKCGAPIGVRCRSMPRGYRPLDYGDRRARELLHPHQQRWTPDVPKR